MAKTAKIAGHHAPSPKLTPLGAALVALLVALPVGGLIALMDWLI